MSADPDPTAGLRVGPSPLADVMARAPMDRGPVGGAMIAPPPADQPALEADGPAGAPGELPPTNEQAASAVDQSRRAPDQSADAAGHLPTIGAVAPVNGHLAPNGHGVPNGHGAPLNGHLAPNGHGVPNGYGAPLNGHGSMGSEAGASCTAAQLRRFIKSRAYVPMHELRRRFELNGEADDVSAVATQHGLVYFGLPTRESQLIGELVRQGEVGVELCRDPRVPIAVGVYPMRPITRQ